MPKNPFESPAPMETQPAPSSDRWTEENERMLIDEEDEWKPPEEKEIGGLKYEVDSHGVMNFGFTFNIGFSHEKTPEELAKLKKIGVDAAFSTKTVDLRDLIVMEGGMRHDAGGDLLCLPKTTTLEEGGDGNIYFTLQKSHIRCKIDMHSQGKLKDVTEA